MAKDVSAKTPIKDFGSCSCYLISIMAQRTEMLNTVVRNYSVQGMTRGKCCAFHAVAIRKGTEYIWLLLQSRIDMKSLLSLLCLSNCLIVVLLANESLSAL